MGKPSRTLQKILTGLADANIRFVDLTGLLRSLGFAERVRGDHHIFTRVDIEEILNLPGATGSRCYRKVWFGGIPRRRGVGDRRLRELISMLHYEVILYWSADDSSYLAEVPELPGCMADGQSYQEALTNVERVMTEWLETAREQGRSIPEPKGRLIYA